MGSASGAAQGQGQAYVKGGSEEGAGKMRGVQREVDHLGIEG